MFQPDKLADLISKPAQKADPLSLRSLVEWLERQDGETEYDYGCNGHCLIAQYLNAVGVKCAAVVPRAYREGGEPIYKDFSREFESVAISRPHTFGAALQRARNLLSEGKE